MKNATAAGFISTETIVTRGGTETMGQEGIGGA